MIDTIVLPQTIHIVLGVLVMVATLAAMTVTGLLAWRRTGMTAMGYWAMMITQMALALQILVGVKLLKNRSGRRATYIHYLGGLGAFFFFLLYYWFRPRAPPRQGWLAFAMSLLAFLFRRSVLLHRKAYVA